MALNFNVDPYYDDFDDTKNFHRILFKPGKAVQARELTQAQTILQDQITKFANNIFKENSPVTGGQITTNFNCYYIKLQSTYNSTTIDVADFEGLLLTNADGTVTARVIATAPSTGTAGEGDPPTLIVVYKSGTHFTDNEVIYDVNSNRACQAITSSATGQSSVVSIAKGVFFVLGNFVQIEPTTIVLSKYDNTPSKRVGLEITETIYDYANDASLLDPAIGASNYQAPGADRYVISLTLTSKPLYFGDDQYFIELLRIEDGNVFKMLDGSVYAVIDDYFAKRDYETNGDYIVDDFKLTPKYNPDSDSSYIMNVGKGLAYVRGYRVENPAPLNIVSNRARTTADINNDTTVINYGNYLTVSGVVGANGKTFDITTSNTVDFHCVTASDILTTNTTTYSSTLVATGYIRGLDFQSSPTNSDANTYIYKAFVYDLQNQSLSGTLVSATSTTVVFPATNGKTSTVNDAYIGVDISITGGTNAGETRTITGYVGSTRTATVNKAWSVTPDSTSKFVLNFDTTDIESMIQVAKSTFPATIYGKAKIDDSGKQNNLTSGDAILENPKKPELIFPIGLPYVSSISDASYTTYLESRGVTFGVSGSTLSATIPLTGSYSNVIKHIGTENEALTSDLVEENFTIIVTDKGSNSKFGVGDIVPWTLTGRSITMNGDLSVATLTTTTSDLGAFTATILYKVSVPAATNSSLVLKIKNLVKANGQVVVTNGTQVDTHTFVDDSVTSKGQIYIEAAGVKGPGVKQSLYLSDVRRIWKIIDTKASGTSPTTTMFNNSTYDISNNYFFDNGQRDGYYDHASITLKPGAPKPKGNLLIFVDYYKHSGGDGYFSKSSYIDISDSPESYREIPSYTSKNGTTYSLRDCLDFRPSRTNATTEFAFRYSNPSDSRFGSLLPVDSSSFICDYSYYLGRKDKLILTKDKSLQIIEGAPSLTPLAPNEPDGALVLANITHKPYTSYVPTELTTGLSDLSVEATQHRRYTMSDIAGLDTRINRIEYYTALNVMEQNANSLQISDAYGLNRFKNGIMVDDFSSYSASEANITDFSASINRRTKVMTASQTVKNFPLKNLAMVYNMNKPSKSYLSSLNFSKASSGDTNYYMLPYTTTNMVAQKLASRKVNINPFSVSNAKGTISLSPNVDNWVDTTYSPSLLITDPNLHIYQGSDTVNTLSSGDWQTVPGTTVSTFVSSTSADKSYSKNVVNHGAFDGPFGRVVGYTEHVTETTTTSTYSNTSKQEQKNVLGKYSQVDNTYSMSNGYVTDISILPWMRQQEIAVTATNMLYKTQVYSFFDNVSVDNYVRKTNEIELSDVIGTFEPNDVIGYYAAGSFHATGVVIGIYDYPDSNNVRLYVAGDGKTSSYHQGHDLQNATFGDSGYTGTTAKGTFVSQTHYGGQIRVVNSTTSIKLGALAASDTSYVGKVLCITSGTGQGSYATILTYDTSSKVATLDTEITCAQGDIYSIGTFKTNEEGSFYGIFTVPGNTFHTGSRVFRMDNRINGNEDTITTFAEGTFYSQGLQTNKQNIDFGASPAGAKDTFTQTNKRDQVTQSTSSKVTKSVYYTPYDPVAQTFIIEAANYPNGAYISSIRVFFASKPASTDSSSVTLSIVGTLNGYPNGSTLDHSIVTVAANKVKASDTPQYLDSTTYTEFKFDAPVYIQPSVLYAFILKSPSNEYNLWTASNGDTALASSVKNLSTDAYPSSITKISTAPYVGGLFLSQNAQTWSVDQNQSLMFTIERAKFDTSKTPSLRMVVPKKLPQRTLVEDKVDYYSDADNITDNIKSTTAGDVLVDAFNVTTTDFVPSSTSIGYSYSATLQDNTSTDAEYINPGKYGTTMYDHIYLDDNKGERILKKSSNTSFSLYAQLSSTDDAVSPVLSDAGTSLFAIQYSINNCELANSLVSIVDGGSSYATGNTSVSVSAPTGQNGEQAYAAAEITNGEITKIYFTNTGSGYIETPTITVNVSAGSASGASVIVAGETSKNGGPAATRYITKKVVLDAGFDSGDLNVYLTAYRPANTDVLVYYKVLNRNDTQSFDDSSWQLMTKTRNSNTLYSKYRDDLHEYSFAPGTNGIDQGYVSYVSTNDNQTYNSFNQFAIKIVLVTTDKTSVPYLTDMRCIALPSNTNNPIDNALG